MKKKTIFAKDFKFKEDYTFRSGVWYKAGRRAIINVNSGLVMVD